MGNRILKESICTSERIDLLTAEEERFFYRLLVNCDDYGRMDGRPSVLRAKLFPLKIDRIKDAWVDRVLARLEQVGLITTYSVEGRRYLYMRKWAKHQQVRALKAKYPPPPEDDDNHGLPFDISCNQTLSDDGNGEQMLSSRARAESNPNPIQSESESNTHTSAGAEGKDEYSPEFEAFWEKYPRKVNKRGAFKCWRTRLRSGVSVDNLMLAVEHYAAACAGKEEQYILHGATFLGPNNRWQDYLVPQPAGGKNDVDPEWLKQLNASL